MKRENDAAPAVRGDAPSRPGAPAERTNRHGAPDQEPGCITDRNAVRGLGWAAPVAAPALGGALAGVGALTLWGPAALAAVPLPVLAVLLGLAYTLGRTQGRDAAQLRAELEAHRPANLAPLEDGEEQW